MLSRLSRQSSPGIPHRLPTSRERGNPREAEKSSWRDNHSARKPLSGAVGWSTHRCLPFPSPLTPFSFFQGIEGIVRGWRTRATRGRPGEKKKPHTHSVKRHRSAGDQHRSRVPSPCLATLAWRVLGVLGWCAPLPVHARSFRRPSCPVRVAPCWSLALPCLALSGSTSSPFVAATDVTLCVCICCLCTQYVCIPIPPPVTLLHNLDCCSIARLFCSLQAPS